MTDANWWMTLGTAVALVVSMWSLHRQKRLEHETQTQTLIHDQYELCRVLDELRVEHPEVSHMLALPAQEKTSRDEVWANYELFKNNVRKTILGDRPATEQDRTGLYLKEHAVALHVADIYEQTSYQYDLATKANDQHRTEILKMLCEYYEKRLLRNPRFRYHWDHGVSDMMEDGTRKRFDEVVRSKYAGSDLIDAQSPLEDPPAPVTAVPAAPSSVVTASVPVRAI